MQTINTNTHTQQQSTHAKHKATKLPSPFPAPGNPSQVPVSGTTKHSKAQTLKTKQQKKYVKHCSEAHSEFVLVVRSWKPC